MGRVSESQQLRIAVESSPSGVLLLDSESVIRLVNCETERIFARTREELLGKHVTQLIPLKMSASSAGVSQVLIALPAPSERGPELRGLRPDGSLVPIEVGLTPVETTEGPFVFCSVVDVSERRKLDARTHAILESMPNGMLMTDQAGTILLVNRELERLFDYPREELIGSTVEMLFPMRFREAHPSSRIEFFRNPGRRPMGGGHEELFGLRKDGTEFPVELGLNPFETDDGAFIVASIVDISARKTAERERHSLEAQLRQSQKMEALGTLAGGVAHEFNNILSMIIGNAEFLAEHVSGNPVAEEDARQLLLASERGRQVVERILLFSRNEKEQLHRIELSDVVGEATTLLRSTLPSQVQLQLHLDTDEIWVKADATAVHQVLMNLANNAAHAMGQVGVLSVSLKRCYVRDSHVRAHADLQEGEYVRLSVQDSGPGMSAAVLERIFEPFFTTKGRGVGTGLGLSVVHSIMRKHGGAIVARSDPNQGARFDCYFPAINSDVQSIPPVSDEVPRSSKHRILCVDDEASLLRVTERRLKALGHLVTVTTDPRQAVEWLDTGYQKFDLLITDYSMPNMTGLELARIARDSFPDIVVMFVTGFAMALPREQLDELSVFRVLDKPARAQELEQAVTDALQFAQVQRLPLPLRHALVS